jgi:hypothetical protein
MGRASVQVSAAATNRNLAQEAGPRVVRGNPTQLFWRRQIETALHDAKKTRHGMPTGPAVLARWWIAENRPPQSEKERWEVSFECACHWLDEDVHEYRKILLGAIDAAWAKARDDHWQQSLYVQRAVILSCAGERIAIDKQFLLALVNERDYDDVAGVDEKDPDGWMLKFQEPTL